MDGLDEVEEVDLLDVGDDLYEEWDDEEGECDWGP